MSQPDPSNPQPSPPSSFSLAAHAPTLGARERVVDLLQLRFADDNLSIEDYERRVALAYKAATPAELESLVSDLAPPAGTSVTGGPTVIKAILSNNERNGPMQVPRHLQVVSILGNVELDLSDATFAPGVTEIAVSAVFGNVEITVPFGVRVECFGDALFGNFDYKAASIVGYPTAADRTVRITGHASFSSVEIGAEPPRPLRGPRDAPRRLS
jgi:hypothetical protein